MQSLVLATTVVLSSQTPVITTDLHNDIGAFIEAETNKVSEVVQQNEIFASKQSTMYQAKLIIQQVKRDPNAILIAQLAAE